MITTERKGEWFTVADVECLMTDIFGESLNTQQVIDAFRHNKTWFKVEKSEGRNRYKLLNDGLAFARLLISEE